MNRQDCRKQPDSAGFIARNRYNASTSRIMKIKRYFAPDIRQAIRMVREEQGPDAVILSNRKVDGGVEIIAARDFDEQSMMENAKASSPPSAVANPTRLTESQRRAEEVFREALQGAEATLPRVQPFKPEVIRTSPARSEMSKPTPGKNDRPQAVAMENARKRDFMPDRAPPAEMTSAKVLQGLQREVQRMRRTLDIHFAESAWENATRSAPARLDLLRRLAELGFSRKVSVQIANRLGAIEDFDLAWQGSLDLLAGQLPVAEDNLLDFGGIAALVGPTGVGKTTTIAKIATRFRMKHGPRQLALITTDNYRIAAHDQLTTYGRLLDVPVRAVANAEELRQTLASFYDKRLVLIDTAGMPPRDTRLAEQFVLLHHEDIPIRSYLVLSAASQGRVLNQAIDAYAGFNPKACILTKLDEAAGLGAALSTLIERQLPVSLYTDGQQVPEDLYPARTRQLLERCLSSCGEDPDDDAILGKPFGYEEWVTHAHA